MFCYSLDLRSIRRQPRTLPNSFISTSSDQNFSGSSSNPIFVLSLSLSGFLATDDEFSPGNYGIRDQIAALRWVVSEIHAFLGDPNAITIMGHDAGAISSQIHLFSPESRGELLSVKSLNALRGRFF